MKTILLLCVIGATLKLQAQKIKNIIAYEYTLPMGNIPKLPAGDNTVVEPPNTQYYIFCEMDNTKAPLLKSVLINRKSYKFSIEKVVNLPVYYDFFNGQSTQKIPLLEQKQTNCYKIILKSAVKINAEFKDDHKIIITYYNKTLKKYQSITTNSITELPTSVVY